MSSVVVVIDFAVVPEEGRDDDDGGDEASAVALDVTLLPLKILLLSSVPAVEVSIRFVLLLLLLLIFIAGSTIASAGGDVSPFRSSSLLLLSMAGEEFE